MNAFIFRFLFVSGVFLALLACKTQAPPAEKPKQDPRPRSTLLPADFVESLRQDAAYISLDMIKQGKEGTVELADIPSATIDKYQWMLIRVHEFAIQNKEIPSIRDIHFFPSPDLKKVEVVLEKDASFLDNWNEGVITTDNLYLNQILRQYGMQLSAPIQSPLGPSFRLTASEFINTVEFVKAIEPIEGFRMVEPMSMAGDGNRILIRGEGEDMVLIFSVGYGDCPSGCISRSFIQFKIQNGKSVSYAGQAGDPLPEK